MKAFNQSECDSALSYRLQAMKPKNSSIRRPSRMLSTGAREHVSTLAERAVALRSDFHTAHISLKGDIIPEASDFV